MANKYSNLKDLFTAIADAIRAKTGGTATIVADDFPETIESIVANDTTTEDALVEGTLTSYSNDRVTRIKERLFYCEYYISLLENVSFPSCLRIEGSAFFGCTNLKSVNFPRVREVGASGFLNCSKLEQFVAPCAFLISDYCFDSCISLKYVDIAHRIGSSAGIAAYAFSDCEQLEALVIRHQDDGRIVLLPNTNAFKNTPIANGTGYIYVPSALIEQYKTAENWSTYAAQFRALEDYTVDGTTTGELAPEKT